MKCLECEARTEVLETIQRPHGTRRRRRCLECEYRFTTTEVANDRMLDYARDLFKKAGKGWPQDVEAVAAALAVDRRKKQIAARQRRKEFEDYYGEHAPDHLEEWQLREELG